MTQIKLLETYRVTVPDEELEFMSQMMHGRENALDAISRIVLVEIEVRDADSDFDLGQFVTIGDQVPWDEKYFSLDGTSGIPVHSFERPSASNFRVCFFLHEIETGDTITTPYGELELGEPTDMPERLAKICIYESPG